MTELNQQSVDADGALLLGIQLNFTWAHTWATAESGRVIRVNRK